MSWVNLDDVYVNKTGGTISGDLDITGALTVNSGNGDNTTYNVANEITTLRDSVSRTILFNNASGTGANFTINQPISNFTHVYIYYAFGIVVMNPNISNIVTLYRIRVSDDYSFNCASTVLSFDGVNVSFKNSAHYQIYHNNYGATYDVYKQIHTDLYVTKIIGVTY